MGGSCPTVWGESRSRIGLFRCSCYGSWGLVSSIRPVKNMNCQSRWTKLANDCCSSTGAGHFDSCDCSTLLLLFQIQVCLPDFSLYSPASQPLVRAAIPTASSVWHPRNERRLSCSFSRLSHFRDGLLRVRAGIASVPISLPEDCQ